MTRPNARKPKDAKRAAKGEPRARVAHAHPETNAGKLATLEALHAVYGAYAQSCIDTMIARRDTAMNAKDAKAMRAYFAPSVMTSHLATCARAQAVGIVQSWANGLYASVLRGYITEHKIEFTPDEQRQLFTIGKYMVRAPKGGDEPIEQRLIDLYWSWVWDANVSGKRPTFGNAGMMLGQECIRFSPPSDGAAGLGGWWARVSTLEYRKLVSLPLAGHPSLDGKTPLAKSVLVYKRRDGRWTFQFTEYVPPAVKLPPDAPRVGVDVGKRELLVTSDDRHYGARGVPLYDDLWATIKSVRSNRFRQGLRENSKRLDALEARLSGMVKSFVGRAVNEVIRDYPGHLIVLEDLNLVGVRGSRRFAYKEAGRSFARKVDTLFTNPAYTSQECPSCHHVSRLNRVAGQFRCTGCGRVSHADCVGGMGLVGRSYDQQITLDTSVADVRAILRARYFAARGSNLFRYGGSSAGGRVSGSATDAPDAHYRARGGTASNSPVVTDHE